MKKFGVDVEEREEIESLLFSLQEEHVIDHRSLPTALGAYISIDFLEVVTSYCAHGPLLPPLGSW